MSKSEMIEKELEAQLSIVRALKPLSPSGQARVLKAFGRILDADMLVPGVFDQFVRGTKPEGLQGGLRR